MTGGSRRGRPGGSAFGCVVTAVLCLAAGCSTSGAGKGADGAAKAEGTRTAAAATGAAGAATTIVSLSFDNASADQSAVRSLLASRGMKATFFVSSGVVGRDVSSMNWSQLRGLADDGNEIGGKTVNHVDLTTTGEAEARRQVCEDRENLIRRGFHVTDFAYPYAAVNPAIESIVKACGYTTARRVGGIGCPACPSAASIPPADAFSTPTLPVQSNAVSVPEMQRVVSTAEDSGGGWIQFVFFKVCDGCSDTAVRESDLVTLLEWLQSRSARGTVVKTIRDALDGSISVHPGARPG